MKIKHTSLLVVGVCLIGVIRGQSSGNSTAFRCAVIGDTGTGGSKQYEVGARLAEMQRSLQFQSVFMLGDNLYGSQKPRDFRTKFELPYANLLEAGVQFYAVLGNHDAPIQQSYKPFNMNGRRYNTFRPSTNIRFIGLDSSRLDHGQLAWLERQLSDAEEEWKIVFFHHPIYSSGARHGSNPVLRAALEPLFVRYGVTAVLSGHDHFYERMKPQKGVNYFVVGGAAKLRVGNARRTSISANAFDRDNSFLLLEIDGDTMRFQAISRSGKTIDQGSIPKPVSRKFTSD